MKVVTKMKVGLLVFLVVVSFAFMSSSLYAQSVEVSPYAGYYWPGNNDEVGEFKNFTFSYGGGLKAMRLWGPMGFFGDFRGRTMPNFFGHATTWPELSAG